MNKVPLTVITGYLGAGKTTLLLRLLEYAGKNKLRLAVLMNEFGEIGIDTKTIRKGRNIDVVEMAGGCVCCSLTGEFEAAVAEVIKKFKPEHIVLETTGVAEPDAIVIDVQNSLQQVRLDSVVTVADADSLIRFPSLGRTGRIQIEMADIILLNKADLINGKELEEVEEEVKAINPRAVMIRTVRCEVSPEVILWVYANRKKPSAVRIHEHHEAGKIGTFSWMTNKPFDEGKVKQFLRMLPREVYRAKGFIKLDAGGVVLFNYVAGRVEFEDFPKKEDSVLVFIGEGITGSVGDNIVHELEKCLVD